MRSILRFFFVFFVISLTVLILTEGFGIRFETANFWNHHGVFFLAAIATFPRLTLLFSSVASGGLFWWLGFFFAPRILVAVLATITYWNENPFLVVISWLVAIGGESQEKMIVINRGSQWRGQRVQSTEKGFESAKPVESVVEDR